MGVTSIFYRFWTRWEFAPIEHLHGGYGYHDVRRRHKVLSTSLCTSAGSYSNMAYISCANNYANFVEIAKMATRLLSAQANQRTEICIWVVSYNLHHWGLPQLTVQVLNTLTIVQAVVSVSCTIDILAWLRKRLRSLKYLCMVVLIQAWRWNANSTFPAQQS